MGTGSQGVRPRGLTSSWTEKFGQHLSEESLLCGVLVTRGRVFFEARLKGTLVHEVAWGPVAMEKECPPLWIGAKARVDGSVLANSVVIHGHVTGDVVARSLHMAHSGCVRGRVFCQNLRMDFGGVINGPMKTNLSNIDSLIQEKLALLEEKIMD